ncbi:hypothetical protein MTR_4g053480 [Medicago truncatula]|uniref:F-box domain-containing protein n=1 Tax=Medicago truncatula TaxID=3880 RepID=G7JIG2_MEDTR|nr:hypothetical protein MTR_4g053480 [Medicago truncatula]
MLYYKTDRRTRLPIKDDETMFLPDELVTEVLSFSGVKFLMQMSFKFSLLYENSSKTYKVVMLLLDEAENITCARVLNLRVNV